MKTIPRLFSEKKTSNKKISEYFLKTDKIKNISFETSDK